MFRVQDLLILATLTGAVSFAAPAQAEDELAILPFRAKKELRFAKRKLEMWTRQRLPQYYRRDVQAGATTFEHDAAAKILLQCDLEEISCLKSVADIAGVKQLVIGSLNDVGNRFTLRWINYRPQKPIERRMAVLLNKEASERQPDVDHLVACLFGSRCGEVTLIRLEEPYTLWVNGVEMKGPTLRIPEGTHNVRIQKPGYATKNVRHKVMMGDKTSFEPVLVPLDPSLVKKPKDEPRTKPAEGLWMPGEG